MSFSTIRRHPRPWSLSDSVRTVVYPLPRESDRASNITSTYDQQSFIARPAATICRRLSWLDRPYSDRASISKLFFSAPQKWYPYQTPRLGYTTQFNLNTPKSIAAHILWTMAPLESEYDPVVYAQGFQSTLDLLGREDLFMELQNKDNSSQQSPLRDRRCWTLRLWLMPWIGHYRTFWSKKVQARRLWKCPETEWGNFECDMLNEGCYHHDIHVHL